ncbi:MAG: hypothetical protein Q8L88_07610 [Bacteroidota bacterium]|nr:hypothetical protein [Bacteroidota bacterium]
MINTTFKFRPLHIPTIILMLWLMFFDKLPAQIADPVNDKSIFRGAGGVTLGGVVQHWNIAGLGTISQQSFPISVSLPIANRMLLTVGTSGMNTSTTAKVDSSINGIVDTRLSLSYVLPGDKIWLTAGLNLPTGKTKLDTIETRMVSLASQTAFNYKVPTFGQGTSGNFSLVYAGTITRRLVLGIGASYYYKGTYEPINVNPIPKYDPGDEVSANLAFNFITYSKAARISMDLTATYFFEDKINELARYHSGPRAIGLVSYSLKTGKFNHLLQTRLRYHLPNKTLGTGSTEYQSSTQIETQYSFSTPVNEWLNGTIVGEYKLYSPDQTTITGSVVETGKAGIVSFGGDAGFLISDIFYPTVSFRYSTGSFVYEGNQYDVSGIDALVGVKISF